MKKLLLSLIAVFALNTMHAQLTMPADGGSVRGWVGERLGLTDVTINYGRPALRGREGSVWGNIVHEGFVDDANFGKARKIPWRAGANETTTMEFSTDVMVEGKRLAAGKYGFFVAYHPDNCILIFSKNTAGWGSYFYDEEDDVLRVNVKPQTRTTATERLTYSFTDQDDSSAIINLSWEKLNIPFRVSTELQKLQLASIRKELNSTRVFNPAVWNQAASYLAEHKINLEEALQYANRAAAGNPSFHVLATKAEILEQLGKKEEAEQTLKTAAQNASNATSVHFYARRLQQQNLNDKAFELFKINYDHFPNNFTTSLGMARGYAGKGDTKNALKYAEKALPLAKDPSEKTNAENIIKMLKEGKNINS